MEHKSSVNRNIVEAEPINLDYFQLDHMSKSGRYDVSYHGFDWECLYIEGNTNRLVVVLNGAYERPDKMARFNRWTWADLFDGSFLSIEDPMYKMGAITGWYFGDKDNDYCIFVSEIIEQVYSLIGAKELVFYSSSSGATASIRCASYLHHGLVIAINPQLDLTLYREKSIECIEKIIGGTIENDPLKRNSLILEGLERPENQEVHYVFIENQKSEIDVTYTNVLKDRFNSNIKFGVNALSNNVLLWTYEADNGINAHTANDYREILPFILDVSFKFEKGIIDEQVVKNLNEIWYEHYEVIKRNNALIKRTNIIELKSIRSQVRSLLQEIETYESVTINASKSVYNYVEFELDGNLLYEIDILSTSDDVNNYSLVVYDFSNVLRLCHWTCKCGIQEKKYFIIGSGEKISLLVYSGMHGNTDLKKLTINKLIIKGTKLNDADN